MIKGVLFDLGGTLVSYKNVDSSIEILLSELKQRSLTDFSVKELLAFYKEASTDVASHFINKKYYLHRELFTEIFKKFLVRANIEAEPNFFNWFPHLHETLLVDSFDLIQSAKKTLIGLKKKNLVIGIVSNIDNRMFEKICIKTQLDQMIDFKLSSETANSCKPDRKIFEIARKKIGLDNSELLFVGDSIEHDIIGSRNFGIKSVLFFEKDIRAPLQSGNCKTEPDFKITDLSELNDLILNLNR